MQVLITGATGFLGSHLAKALLKNGYDVIVLKRSYSDTWRISDILSKIVLYNLDECALTEPFKRHGKIDAVIHTATCYGRNGENELEIFETNTAFPLNLLSISIEFSIPFFNADSVFSRLKSPLQDLMNSYSISKRQFMEWGRYLATKNKNYFINLQFEHLYGPEDDCTKFTTFVLKNCFKNVPELELTLGEQHRDFIYIDDAIDAFMVLLNKFARNSFGSDYFFNYEVGSGRAITIREFVETVHGLTGSKTILKFGAIPYRCNEIMFSKADTSLLKLMGWKAKTDLLSGVTAILREDGTRWRKL